MIAVSFVFLFILYFIKTRRLETSIFFVFISSLIIQTGKTYPIQLLPAGIFPLEIFPQGYFITLVITSTHFISFAMLILIIRAAFLRPRRFKLVPADYLVVGFYILKILSATLASKEPGLSLPFEILSLSMLIAYFYSRFFIKADGILWKNLTYIFGALVLFEVVLGFTQLAVKSPLYKNIEYQVNIEYFGNAVDETQFSFRPTGTFDHANSLGIWLSSICLLLFSYAIKNKSNNVWLLFFAGIALLIVTISRSAWLGFASGMFLFLHLATKRSKNTLKPLILFVLKWRFLILPVLIFLSVFFVVPRIENSFYSFQADAGAAFFRRIQILDALEIIKLHPLLGIGAVMSVYEGISLDLHTVAASVPLQIHNWYLYVATENGLLAVFSAMFFIAYSLKHLFELKTNSLLNLSLLGAVVSALTAALFQPYINFDLIMVLLSITNSVNMKATNDKTFSKTSNT